ncbi:hypothetical protein [Isoptericola aurantiacus]|uniref:hypothetical protein n=1 Tax=Isoptericola aurantiacus TaxID=3377839 RepID=UPI00383BCEA1
MDAFVESPLQLVCAVEAHAAGVAGPSTVAHVRDGVPTLAETTDAVVALGLPVGLDLHPGPAVRRLASGDVLVGDVFSGAFQAALVRSPPTAPRRLVVVDDGLATLDLIRRLVANEPLVRLASRPGPLRLGLGSLAGRRLRRLANEGRLILCTGLPVPDDLAAGLATAGVQIARHRFDWLTSRSQHDAPDEPTVVVGSALVADRLVHADQYVSWVRGIAADGPVRYVPHRRHEPMVTALLERVPGIRVDAPGAPVEIRLRGLRPHQRVVTLPSTSAVTLSQLLAPRGVAVVSQSVPTGWWTDRAGPQLRRHLEATHDLAVLAVASAHRDAGRAPDRTDAVVRSCV